MIQLESHNGLEGELENLERYFISLIDYLDDSFNEFRDIGIVLNDYYKNNNLEFTIQDIM